MATMIDWIEWTKCPTCGYAEKEVFQKPDDDAAPDRPGAGLPCPQCGNHARRITFPVFEIETIDVSMSGDAFRDEMEDW